jgi:hypothetical protein
LQATGSHFAGSQPSDVEPVSSVVDEDEEDEDDEDEDDEDDEDVDEDVVVASPVDEVSSPLHASGTIREKSAAPRALRCRTSSLIVGSSNARCLVIAVNRDTLFD